MQRIARGSCRLESIAGTRKGALGRISWILSWGSRVPEIFTLNYFWPSTDGLERLSTWTHTTILHLMICKGKSLVFYHYSYCPCLLSRDGEYPARTSFITLVTNARCHKKLVAFMNHDSNEFYRPFLYIYINLHLKFILFCFIFVFLIHLLQFHAHCMQLERLTQYFNLLAT